MLDIMKVESDNEVNVSGILNELDIVEGVTSDGRGWIRGTANILVDQEINGVATENIVPIKMFSMRNKTDGNLNKVYDIILGYKEQLTSVAAAEKPSDASKVTVNGARLEENIWFDKTTNKERSTFQISGNFLNNKRDSDKEGATFRLSGFVLETKDEIDKNEEATGRLIIKFGIIRYNGRLDVINLIADENAKAHIEQNWQEGDTVKVTGRINMTQKTETYYEEQGFGEPIERVRTVSRKELIVTGGSAGPLEEDFSYDADSVRAACVERRKRIEEIKDKNASTAKSKVNDFGF